MDILLTATWKEWWVKRGAKKMSFILATMHSILKIKEVFNMYGGQNSSNTLPTIITQMPVKYWDFQEKEIPVFHPVFISKISLRVWQWKTCCFLKRFNSTNKSVKST
jgi:hypothetical protein